MKSRELKRKYEMIPVQVKASLWFVVCSVIQKGLSIITVPLFTRLMTTEQYGYYTTYISWYNILLVFTSLNLFYGVFNNAMLKYRQDRAGYISSMQGLVFSITAGFFAVYLILHGEINILLGMSTPLVLMLFLELLMTPCLHFWMAAKKFDYDYKPIVFITLIKAFANPILGLILVITTKEKDIARIASIVIVEFIICSIIAVVQFAKGKKFFVGEYWRYALLFNLPLLPHYLAGQVLSQSDRIMISKISGNTAVAIYGVAYNIGLLMNIFTSAINGSYTPWYYQTLDRKEYSNVKTVTKVIVVLMGALVTILMFFGPEIISILGSQEYHEGVYCIPPVAASAFFIFLYNIYANVEFYFEKRHYVLYGSVFAALLNIGLNFVFIPRYGYVAAAYTTLFSYLIYCGLHSLFATRICRKEGIPRNHFGTSAIAIVSIAVVCIALLMNIIYLHFMIRYGIILIVMLVLLMKRKEIIRLVKGTMSTMRAKNRYGTEA